MGASVSTPPRHALPSFAGYVTSVSATQLSCCHCKNSHRECLNEWTGLCTNKTLFLQISNGWPIEHMESVTHPKPPQCLQLSTVPRHRGRWAGLHSSESVVTTVIWARSLGTYRMVGTTLDPGDTVVSRTAMASGAQFGEGHRQQSNGSMTTVKSELCHGPCWGLAWERQNS